MLGKVQLMASNKKTLAAVEGFPSRPPNALPAYQRIQSVIRKRIDSGQLQAGDPVPSERELAKTHHVSLMTARHALASLEREGFVERRRGIGTFVAPPKIHFNKLMSYTEQMAARTLSAGAKVLFAKIVDNENEAAARLSRSKSAISAPPSFPACLTLPSHANRCSAFSSAITKSNWVTPTKKSTLPLPIRASLTFSPYRGANRCCAFARSFILRRVKPSCTCSVSTAPTGIIW